MSQLKEINGRYYQEAEVVMLATKYGKITLHDYDNLKTLSLAQGNHKGTENTIIPQHLYILSNEEIKEGDWFLDDDRMSIRENNGNPNWEVRKCTHVRNGWIFFDKEESQGCNSDWSKKIISTTNNYLKLKVVDRTTCKPIDSGIMHKYKNIHLPRPSDSFIKKYIEEYNKGNIITNVLVEYEISKSYSGNSGLKVKQWLKVDSNNCITIKRLEPELYTREEVKILITNAFKAGYERSHNGYPHTDNWSKPKVEEFLKENL